MQERSVVSGSLGSDANCDGCMLGLLGEWARS
jgi:hypothetical protein